VTRRRTARQDGGLYGCRHGLSNAFREVYCGASFLPKPRLQLPMRRSAKCSDSSQNPGQSAGKFLLTAIPLTLIFARTLTVSLPSLWSIAHGA
jgi:hypothetical protein